MLTGYMMMDNYTQLYLTLSENFTADLLTNKEKNSTGHKHLN